MERQVWEVVCRSISAQSCQASRFCLDFRMNGYEFAKLREKTGPYFVTFVPS